MLIANRFAGISAFACGAVIAMVVLAARQDLTAAPAIYVHTCAAADGSLRYTEATVACAPEERRIRIRLIIGSDGDARAGWPRATPVRQRC